MLTVKHGSACSCPKCANVTEPEIKMTHVFMDNNLYCVLTSIELIGRHWWVNYNYTNGLSGYSGYDTCSIYKWNEYAEKQKANIWYHKDSTTV